MDPAGPGLNDNIHYVANYEMYVRNTPAVNNSTSVSGTSTIVNAFKRAYFGPLFFLKGLPGTTNLRLSRCAFTARLLG